MKTQIVNAPVWKRKVEKRDTSLGSKQKYILRWAKKIKAIEYKGGKCCKCGEKRIYVLVFHHVDSELKENNIENMIRVQKRWSDIQIELNKCDLVCENCHREIHSEKEHAENDKRTVNKKICLDFKNVSKCVVCGYSKCDWALEFHHNSEKLFGISKYCSKYTWKSIGDLQNFVIDELNKCDIYCANCHKEKHFDLGKFIKFNAEIFSKTKNLSEKKPSVNKLNVLSLLKNGKTIKEISTELNCSYFRVYEISKEYGIRDSIHKVDKKQIWQLWKQGKTRKQIMSETGYSKSTVLKTINEGLFNEEKNLRMPRRDCAGESTSKS